MAAAMEGNDGLLDKLAAFGRCVESSSLYIELAIDNTIDALQEVDQIARALALSCENITKEISMSAVLARCALDPGHRVIDGLSAGRQRIDNLLPGLMSQRSALEAMNVPEQHQHDLLNFAFDRSIESFTWVVDAVKKVRQTIITHDLAAEPSSGDTVDADAALFGSLQINAA